MPAVRVALAFIALGLTLASARAAEPCAPSEALVVDGLGTPADELVRLADLEPGALAPASGLIRRGGMTWRAACADGPATPWSGRYAAEAPGRERALVAVPPRLLSAFRNLSPGGANDGLLWQGRGASAMVSGGVAARWGILSAQLAPAVAWASNEPFTTVPTSAGGDLAYASAFYGDTLDLPQRFGDGAFRRASLGQSYLQLEALGARLGVSTENRWWGPGIRNSLLLSNNAEGFPHAFLGTARPVNIGIGDLETELLWGRLQRSKYFVETENESPAFTAVALVFQPRFVKGLYLGVGRSFVESWESFRNDYGLSAVQWPTQAAGNVSDDNQFLSFWMRWVMAPVGFELYAEWAREDYGNFGGLVRIPDRTAAWTVGLQKLHAVGTRWVRFQLELSRTRDALPPPWAFSMYTHPRNVGYSHEGQILGASIGPGADSQFLAVDVFTRSGRIGGYVERVRRNDEYFWRSIASPESRGADRDAELVGAIRQVRFAGPLELSWEAGAGYRWNRDFVRHEPVFRALVSVAAPWGGSRARSP